MAEKSSDIALSVGEFLWLQTISTGRYTTHVGPTNVTTSENQRHMIPDGRGGLMAVESGQSKDRAIQRSINARRNQYVILSNPASKDKPHPTSGQANDDTPLKFGEIQVIPGPCHFALWPGQEAKVIDAHTLRTGQYLVIEVNNETEALANWQEATMGTAPWTLGQEVVANNVIDTDGSTHVATNGETDGDGDGENQSKTLIQKPAATDNHRIQGRQYIITGREVSFFVPVTGIEVVKDGAGKYVREALVLQQLEYCVLVSETGQKTVVRGPGIVFPRNAGETFYTYQSGNNPNNATFRPIELGKKRMGIYVKALVDFTDESGKQWEAGEEGFITGEDIPFFYPDERLDIIMYGNKLVLYAVTVEAGKAYYLLNRDTGQIELVKGPAMLLPNPVQQVFIERMLTENEQRLWYPGRTVQRGTRDTNRMDYGEAEMLRGGRDLQLSDTMQIAPTRKGGFEALIAFSTQRDNQFSEPRVIKIGNEVPQAPRINVWQNFAVQIKNAANETRFVVGPQSTFLEYDEELVTFIKPNDSSQLDVYLQVANNAWTFSIEAQTSDGVDVALELVASANFTGEVGKAWWSIENPWRMVFETLQAKLIPYIAAHQLEELITPTGYANMLAQVISTSDDGEQTPIEFGENSMQIERIYISDFAVADAEVQALLERSRVNMVKLDLQRATATEEAETFTQLAELQATITAKKLEILAQTTSVTEAEARAREAVNDIVASIVMERKLREAENQATIQRGQDELRITMLKEQTEAMVKRLSAIAPHDSAYLRQIVGGQLLNQFAETFGGSAQRAGVPLMEYVTSILKGTQFESLLGLFELPAIESNKD